MFHPLSRSLPPIVLAAVAASLCPAALLPHVALVMAVSPTVIPRKGFVDGPRNTRWTGSAWRGCRELSQRLREFFVGRSERGVGGSESQVRRCELLEDCGVVGSCERKVVQSCAQPVDGD